MKLAIVLAAALLAGCANLNQQGIDAVNRGDLTAAERLFTQAIQNGDPSAWNNLGVVFERRGQNERARDYYTMGARWGDPMAQRNLTNLGLPVPSADLAAQRAHANAANASANAANTAATLHMINALRPAPTPFRPPVTCSSYRVGNDVRTECN